MGALGRGDRELARLGSTLIDEMAVLPRGKHDDLADSCVYGLKFLRDNGILLMPAELQARIDQQRSYENRKPATALYPG